MNTGQESPPNPRTPDTRRGRAASSAQPPPPPRQDPAQQEAPPRRHKHLLLYTLLLLVILSVIFTVIMVRKARQLSQLKSATRQMAVPTVQVVHPQKDSADLHLVLPGAVQAYVESSIYAQISGYIKQWMVDIGAPVKRGQLLAEIEAPVIEQQLQQAQGNLGQAQANLELAKVTAARYNSLLAQNAVSQQDADNQNAGVKVQEANVAAAQAYVSGIRHALAFKQVVAPFDGVVTARRVDVGDLVTAGGGTSSSSGTAVAGTTPSSGGSSELFRVAQTNVLRVYVTVPESDSAEVRPGVSATIHLASNPNLDVPGTLVRTSKAIDSSSLTLLAELDVNNADGKLLPGGYAQVHFNIKQDKPPLLIPGNSLIFRAQGPQVGTVDGNGTVQLKDITIGRDLGTKLEITQGLDVNDQVIINPSDSLTNGLKVNVKQEDKPPTPPQA